MDINVKNKIGKYIEKNIEKKENRERIIYSNITEEKTKKRYAMSKVLNLAIQVAGLPFCVGVMAGSAINGEMDTATLFGCASLSMAFAKYVLSKNMGFLEDEALHQRIVANEDNTFITSGVQQYLSNIERKTTSTAGKDTSEKEMFNK